MRKIHHSLVLLLCLLVPLHSDEKQEDYKRYGIYQKTAPLPGQAKPIETTLPLNLNEKSRIAFIGNTLLERSQYFGYFETMLHQHFPKHQLIVRNLSWSADTPDVQPRPANFASTVQHLTHEKIDVIFAAYGFNESFKGKQGLDAFKKSLTEHVTMLKSKAFNGKTGPQIVLLSPIASEDVKEVSAGKRNNANIKLYANAIREVAKNLKVAYVDVFTPMQKEGMTFNGIHLNDKGYRQFSKELFTQLFGQEPTTIDEKIRQVVLDKNRQYFRRFRPANTFYYTGNRNKAYGYLDFLPAMRNFDILVANREKRIWDLAQGKTVAKKIDDSNVPPLPKTVESRGANQWMSAKDEMKAFKVDPRFEVNLFAGEEQFPDMAAPIQMRWDNRGRLWVSTSKTYPHVYPGNEPEDKIVILEDTDGDGRADKSTVFADKLHIPLSFVLGDGGVYVSEMPHLTFLKDTDGDGKADVRRRLLTGFGTEDSHHSLHDFTWTPDGDLLFRESIFHHSQVETPYGPVRQQNSGWFRYEPRTHRLISFGTYHSTNPWGVTFDDWGRHIASHPIFASAFHARDPKYPNQHPAPRAYGLQAYSGVAGHEIVDFKTMPDELQGHMIKARYKPTNRVEILKWKEQPFGFEEEYVSDLLFSSNLSFIPTDLRFGPDGAIYVCDWYNPVKGHAQYSLRDERRDRHSGRIWRITAKGKKLQEPPKIHGATIEQLLDILKQPEYRYRYWAKRELRDRDFDKVKKALDAWVKKLDPKDARYRHHQVEAIWTYRVIREVNVELLREVLKCDNHHARAAATQQIRYWHPHLKDAIQLLTKSATDANGLVRLEAVIAATYLGTPEALNVVKMAAKLPHDKHLTYAITTAFGAETLARHWDNDDDSDVPKILQRLRTRLAKKPREPKPTRKQRRFDRQPNIKTVRIDCIPERMLFSVKQVIATTGQPLKIVFVNEDATDHNLVMVKPDVLEEVGMAANEMAKDPQNANSDFIPKSKEHLILQHSPMIGPTRKSQIHVFRFHAPKKPGIYPYVCTFPGHWVIMHGEMIVVNDLSEVDKILASRKSKIVKEWTMADFPTVKTDHSERAVMRGMMALTKARCLQCHQVHGHGVNLGPDLTKSHEKYKGQKLLQQILEPSSEIHEKYQTYQFELSNGQSISGFVIKETPKEYHVARNLLAPNQVTVIKKNDVDDKLISKVSAMPQGMVNVLTRDEIIDLLAFLETGGYKLPKHLKHGHNHK